MITLPSSPSSEFGHTITSSPLINLEPVNETNGTDSENVTETGEADIEPMYATPTAATSTKAEPMYANTCVGNTNQELAYATPELPKSTSKKPFLPKDTEVQYSEIQPCTEEGAISKQIAVHCYKKRLFLHESQLCMHFGGIYLEHRIDTYM